MTLRGEYLRENWTPSPFDGGLEGLTVTYEASPRPGGPSNELHSFQLDISRLMIDGANNTRFWVADLSKAVRAASKGSDTARQLEVFDLLHSVFIALPPRKAGECLSPDGVLQQLPGCIDEVVAVRALVMVNKRLNQ